MTDTYGMKVSEAGYDVKTAADKNLILKTDITMLKVFASGTINLTTDWYEVTHNLGYVPQFLVFIQYPGFPDYGEYADTFLGTASYNYGIARVDTTKIYIRRTTPDNSTAYYYIFYEQA